jgi:predicted DNA-binding transcriptional regulator AlpA
LAIRQASPAIQREFVSCRPSIKNKNCLAAAGAKIIPSRSGFASMRKSASAGNAPRAHGNTSMRFCDDAVLTIEQFAALLGIHVLTLRRMIKNKKGPPLVRVNERHYGIVMRAGRKWIQSRAVEQE